MNSFAIAAGTRLADIVGAQNFTSDPQQLSAYAVDGIVPAAVARPGTAAEVAELVKFAAAENLAVIPTGARTKLGIGMPPSRYDLAIDMTRLDRVISYDPGDLTLSVETGIPLARLAQVLGEHNQFLPLDVPFCERATVGGTLASGVDSPLRQLYGTPRDFVLGMEFVTGEGVLAKSGGRVVKNVTGYDLHKLMLGAIGTLGVIARVNFKTFPFPVRPATFIASFPSIQAASAFNLAIHRSALRCLRIEILSPSAVSLISVNGAPISFNLSGKFVVAVSVAGSDVTLARCEREVHTMSECADNNTGDFAKIEGSNEEAFWSAIREFPAAFVNSRCDAIIKVSCLPSEFAAFFDASTRAAAQHTLEVAHIFRGYGICYCALSSHDATSPQPTTCCKELFQHAASSGRNAQVVWCSLELKRELNIWGSRREDFPLIQRVKKAFDPHNIFAPGRFVGGL